MIARMCAVCCLLCAAASVPLDPASSGRDAAEVSRHQSLLGANVLKWEGLQKNIRKHPSTVEKHKPRWCKAGVNCINGNCDPTTGECICRQGMFKGERCDQLICPGKCNGNGHCGATGDCVCNAGWKGVDCTSPACVNSCNGHGTCHAGSCKCDLGWKGHMCNNTYCPSLACSSHGNCSLTEYGEACVCQKGWTGGNCAKSHCPKGCQHGRCAGGGCQCLVGWTGSDCSLRACNDSCMYNGECSTPEAEEGELDEDDLRAYVPHCICKPGWAGPICNMSVCVDDCNSHGACVQNSSLQMECNCQPEFQGNACEELSCFPHNCNDHGICKNGTCWCDDLWDGPHCTQQMCPHLCSGHGTCTTHRNCSCEIEWEGHDCSIPSNQPHSFCITPFDHQWPSLECSGHGCCRNSHENGTLVSKCACDGAWTGWLCDIPWCKNNETGMHNCSEHGICQPDPEQGGALQCYCDQGWLGDQCQQKACLVCDHGTFNNETGRCDCPPGWVGKFCSHQVAQTRGQFVPECTPPGVEKPGVPTCGGGNGSNSSGNSSSAGGGGNGTITMGNGSNSSGSCAQKEKLPFNCSGYRDRFSGVCQLSKGVCQCRSGCKIHDDYFVEWCYVLPETCVQTPKAHNWDECVVNPFAPINWPPEEVAERMPQLGLKNASNASNASNATNAKAEKLARIADKLARMGPKNVTEPLPEDDFDNYCLWHPCERKENFPKPGLALEFADLTPPTEQLGDNSLAGSAAQSLDFNGPSSSLEVQADADSPIFAPLDENGLQ